MPDYTPPPLFSNGHIQSVYPSLFRRTDSSFYRRERIDTPDNDFLDLDWGECGASRLIILSHGLEGNSKRAYVTGMARAVMDAGWDALAWNYRSCSGEPNRRLRSYHNGATDDLARVIDHARQTERYREIRLIGFSLGGNLTLVHLGRDRVDPMVSGAVVFSVPCDLAASARALARPANRIYMKRFLKDLRRKIRAKMALMPRRISDRGFESITTFKEFDDRYTAPIHGFRDARDYWRRCSSRQFILNIRVPTLIVNAKDDPFLAGGCYPFAEAAANPDVRLETPEHGGHVGFVLFNGQGRYWSELRAVRFLNGA